MNFVKAVPAHKGVEYVIHVEEKTPQPHYPDNATAIGHTPGLGNHFVIEVNGRIAFTVPSVKDGRCQPRITIDPMRFTHAGDDVSKPLHVNISRAGLDFDISTFPTCAFYPH